MKPCCTWLYGHDSIGTQICGHVNVMAWLTLSLPRVINFEFSLQPHQKYYTTQYEERGLLRWSVIIISILNTTLVLLSLEVMRMYFLLTLSLPGVINFKFALTRTNTSHSMKNLASHSSPASEKDEILHGTSVPLWNTVRGAYGGRRFTLLNLVKFFGSPFLQAGSVNRGLDRCAVLLTNILKSEKKGEVSEQLHQEILSGCYLKSTEWHGWWIYQTKKEGWTLADMRAFGWCIYRV